MASLTALEIVQRTLSAIDSDNVESISDTVESEQVFMLVKTVYESLLAYFPWHHRRDMVALEVTDIAHIMRIPSNVVHIMDTAIRYNKKDVIYIHPRAMMRLLEGRDTSLSYVDDTGAINNEDPHYWTTYDEEEVIFDSYDGTLVASYSSAWCDLEPTVLLEDTDVPSLPDILNSVLLYGVLEEAFRTLKGDETTARSYGSKYNKGLATAKRWARRVNRKGNTYPQNYGRKATVRGNEINSNYVVEGK